MSELDLLRSTIADELARAMRLFDGELDSRFPFVRELCARVSQFRGKMLRPTLLLLSGKACGQISHDHLLLAAVIEMAHVATLVHDDVLDESEIRRAAPTIHRMTHNEAAVLLGDYLISHAYHLCSSLSTTRASRRIAAATNRVCEGELLQVHHRGDWSLSEELYLEIIRAKTAELTRAACELGAAYAGADESTTAHLAAFGEHVGMAFQIIDDLIDLTADAKVAGKSVGRDAGLGKPTLPVIHALARANPEARSELLELVSAVASGDTTATPRLRERLVESGGIEYARRVARTNVEAALSRIAGLPDSGARQALKLAAEFTLARRA